MVLLVSSGKIIQEITVGIDNLVDECSQEWFLKATRLGVSMPERTNAHTQYLN